mmetsp:Transcript_73717/g.175517  ORF Transcript_73717/g.175517 Transcript_73717/m.175517 type:complete len:229 (-) Transcript_73717:170-856(-)
MPRTYWAVSFCSNYCLLILQGCCSLNALQPAPPSLHFLGGLRSIPHHVLNQELQLDLLRVATAQQAAPVALDCDCVACPHRHHVLHNVLVLHLTRKKCPPPEELDALGGRVGVQLAHWYQHLWDCWWWWCCCCSCERKRSFFSGDLWLWLFFRIQCSLLSSIRKSWSGYMCWRGIMHLFCCFFCVIAVFILSILCLWHRRRDRTAAAHQAAQCCQERVLIAGLVLKPQ